MRRLSSAWSESTQRPRRCGVGEIAVSDRLLRNYQDYYADGDSEWRRLGALGKAENIVAFVTLKSSVEGNEDLLSELREHVSKKIGKIARPAMIIFTDDLPKTRSGKIMRRLLRDVAEGRPLGDVTTLANENVVEEIRDKAAARSGADED